MHKPDPLRDLAHQGEPLMSDAAEGEDSETSGRPKKPRRWLIWFGKDWAWGAHHGGTT
jgi:hypothetical protein